MKKKNGAKKNGAIILIPARMGSTRLPGKPLLTIHGEAMITHVWRRACRAGIPDVVVVCQEEEIARVIRDAGGKAEVEAFDHISGTDRIAAVVERLDADGGWDPVINLQGDMPVFDPAILGRLITILDHSGADMATCAFEIDDWQRRSTPSVVKVDVDWNGEWGMARDFARTPFAPKQGTDYHHLGIYAYRRAALRRFIELGPSPREKAVRLEQLRALDGGMTIAVGRIASYESGSRAGGGGVGMPGVGMPVAGGPVVGGPGAGGVDTMEDLEHLRESMVIKGDSS